jgi:hypothetical protein
MQFFIFLLWVWHRIRLEYSASDPCPKRHTFGTFRQPEQMPAYPSIQSVLISLTKHVILPLPVNKMTSYYNTRASSKKRQLRQKEFGTFRALNSQFQPASGPTATASDSIYISSTIFHAVFGTNQSIQRLSIHTVIHPRMIPHFGSHRSPTKIQEEN